VEADVTDDFEDGNTLAGPLSEVFAVDITTATVRCAHCGATGPVATLRVYTHAPGSVARCPGCEEVVLRLVRTPDSAWLDLRGTVALRIPLGDPSPAGAAAP
jgi:NAD-dependent SIR2 family protein deacetylase